jgi:protein involved in polysaccharide export with SLBB domain
MRFFLSASRIISIFAIWPLLLLAGMTFGSESALAEYKLQPGDKLAVLITGVPNFKEELLIGVDGTIILPLGGQIKINGLSLSEAKTEIVRALSNKTYQQMTNDGRQIEHLILPAEIVVTIVGYRPVYVSGDVAKPGEYPFRPGITVRQAVAVAGGYDLVKSQGLGPFPAVDRNFLQEAIKKIDFQMNVLTEKKKTDEESYKFDAADYEKARELTGKGLSVATRALDARRAVLMSSDQILRTRAEMSSLALQRDEYGRQLKKLELALGTIGRPDIMIYRKDENGPQQLEANEDLELAPGDVVNVTLHRNSVTEAPAPQSVR